MGYLLLQLLLLLQYNKHTRTLTNYNCKRKQFENMHIMHSRVACIVQHANSNTCNGKQKYYCFNTCCSFHQVSTSTPTKESRVAAATATAVRWTLDVVSVSDVELSAIGTVGYAEITSLLCFLDDCRVIVNAC